MRHLLTPLILPAMLALAPLASAQSAVEGAGALSGPLSGPGIDRPVSFATLAKRLSPAVVNISTSQNIEANVDMPEFPKDSPLERFNDFFGNGEGRVSSSLGSGFVIDAAGHIATNNHVIDEADIIEVTFPNGDNYVAKLLGRDVQTDVALLKIERDEPFPFVEWADSDSADVGEWVMAIGNPFGYGGSVTAGIVSARNRNISHGKYDDFIQSDVAINKGNSGGPLFDMSGKVVGMNTAILSPSGGSVGISFTTPSNIVSHVIDQLGEYGETRRGYLGVNVQEVSAAHAKSFKLDAPYGALVTKVSKGGPAANAGLKRGDLLLTYGGERLEKSSDLSLLVSLTKIDAVVDVTYMRKRKTRTAKITIERLKEKSTRADDADNGEVQKSAALGLSVQTITPPVRRKYRIHGEANGLRIDNIDSKSDASGKLRIGDVIEEVEFEPVANVAEFKAAVDAAKDSGRPIMLLINRGGTSLFYAIFSES
ncbi:MAG: Do family serine endopeptidase [Robiginitomaculum sp.]